MNLKFLGIGSAFQSSLYNNCAYVKEEDKLFLIDCGETGFEQLKRQADFSEVSDIYVVFTHTHSDHIAGLGQLVDYCEQNLGKKLNIIVPTGKEDTLKEDIVTLLDIFEIPLDKCNFLSTGEVNGQFKAFQTVEFLPTFHAPELEGKCYSLIFNTEMGKVLYTSDSVDTKYIQELVNTDFASIYADVTLSTTVHLSLNTLKEIVPEHLRNKVYCMHFDHPNTIEKAREEHFQIAPSIATDLSLLPKEFEYENLGDKLVLSDCGELTFMHLQRQNLLNGVKKIYLPLKNTHHEAVSSLGSLLTYSYFVLHNPLYICTEDDRVIEHMKELIKLYGTPQDSIEFRNHFPVEFSTREIEKSKQKSL